MKDIIGMLSRSRNTSTTDLQNINPLKKKPSVANLLTKNLSGFFRSDSQNFLRNSPTYNVSANAQTPITSNYNSKEGSPIKTPLTMTFKFNSEMHPYLDEYIKDDLVSRGHAEQLWDLLKLNPSSNADEMRTRITVGVDSIEYINNLLSSEKISIEQHDELKEGFTTSHNSFQESKNAIDLYVQNANKQKDASLNKMCKTLDNGDFVFGSSPARPTGQRS